MAQNEIVVAPHGSGYKAYFQSNSGKWESGQTQAEALGKLMVSHSSIFNVRISYESVPRS